MAARCAASAVCSARRSSAWRGDTARGGAVRAAADGAMGALGADDVAGSVRGGASKECGELGGAAHSAMFAVAPLDSAVLRLCAAAVPRRCRRGSCRTRASARRTRCGGRCPSGPSPVLPVGVHHRASVPAGVCLRGLGCGVCGWGHGGGRCRAAVRAGGRGRRGAVERAVRAAALPGRISTGSGGKRRRAEAGFGGAMSPPAPRRCRPFGPGEAGPSGRRSADGRECGHRGGHRERHRVRHRRSRRRFRAPPMTLRATPRATSPGCTAPSCIAVGIASDPRARRRWVEADGPCIAGSSQRRVRVCHRPAGYGHP